MLLKKLLIVSVGFLEVINFVNSVILPLGSLNMVNKFGSEGFILDEKRLRKDSKLI